MKHFIKDFQRCGNPECFWLNKVSSSQSLFMNFDAFGSLCLLDMVSKEEFNEYKLYVAASVCYDTIKIIQFQALLL